MIEKRLQHRCFSVNIAKFLRTRILRYICERLLGTHLFYRTVVSSRFCIGTFIITGYEQKVQSKLTYQIVFMSKKLIISKKLIHVKDIINPYYCSLKKANFSIEKSCDYIITSHIIK